jgi:hypothetical protein
MLSKKRGSFEIDIAVKRDLRGTVLYRRRNLYIYLTL